MCKVTEKLAEEIRPLKFKSNQPSYFHTRNDIQLELASVQRPIGTEACVRTHMIRSFRVSITSTLNYYAYWYLVTVLDSHGALYCVIVS